MITPIIKDGVVSSWGDYLYKYYDASSDSIKEIKVTYQTDTKPMMDVESPAGRFQSVLEKVDADSIKEDIYQCFDPTCIGTKRILRETRIFKFEKITTPPLMPPPGGDVMPFLGIWTEFSRGSAIFMESPEVLVGNYGIGLVPLFKFQVP